MSRKEDYNKNNINLLFRSHTVLQHLPADQLDIVDQGEDHLFGADTPRHADQGVHSDISKSEKNAK